MKETLQFLAHYGYWLLVGAVLCRQAFLPVPANLCLLAAGAVARSGKLSFAMVLAVSVLTFLVADLAWYEAGRRWGHRTLHFLCSLSHDPESCVRKATDAFERRGVRMLIPSKFVGLDAVAAQLTGASNVPPAKFLLFDGIGAVVWSSAYAGLGYIFSDQLDRVAVHLVRMGALLMLTAVAVFGFHMVKRVGHWLRFVRMFRLARITPEELNGKLSAGESILIVDLQGGKGNGAGLMAIPGAVRINPRSLEQYRGVEIPHSQDVVLYCASPGEFISARVALDLQRRGIERVRPLEGGLQRWRACGYPVTTQVSVPVNPSIHT